MAISGLDDHVVGNAAGTRVGRYLVVETAGQGGMGVVLRAYDPKLQREVALKLLKTASMTTGARAPAWSARRGLSRG